MTATHPPQLSTADLCDEFSDTLQIAQPGFRDYGGHTCFYGEITTLKLFEDNSLVRSQLEQPGNGKVLVVDGGGSERCALLGDQLAELGVKNGWSGVIVYGCIRDSAAIAEMPIGVKALGTMPLKSVKRNQGLIDETVSFYGINFKAGEYVYCDHDGIVVSKKSLI